MEKPIPKLIEKISDVDWEKTPTSVRCLVEVLVKRIEEHEQQLKQVV